MLDGPEFKLMRRVHAHRIIIMTLVKELAARGMISEQSFINSLREVEREAIRMNDEETTIDEFRKVLALLEYPGHA